MFLIGIVLITLGSLFKIIHLPGSNVILVIAIFFEAGAGILAIWKVLTANRFKEFLNS